MDKRGGGRRGRREGVSRFSVKIFLSHSAEKFRRGTLLCCFRNFPVAKKFMDKRGWGEYQNFPSKIFCLTVPKIFVGEPLSVSLISGTKNGINRKNYCQGSDSNPAPTA